MNQTGLVFDKVSFSRGDFNLFADTTFPSGKLSVVLGPSGCGKTTLLDLAAGFIHPQTGCILEGSREVSSLPPEKRQVGVVFQDHALFPHMSVRRNIMFGPLSRGIDRKTARNRADELLETIRMESFAGRRPSSLSGGEKQRVALARALAINPHILLMDEPFSALDAALRRGLRAEVRRIQQETGITAILVTHDQEEALAVADHLAVMDKGRILDQGSPLELWLRPKNKFSALFLGQSTRLRIQSAEEEAKSPEKLRIETAAGSISLENRFGKSAGDLEGDWLMLRPKAITLSDRGIWHGRLIRKEFSGDSWRLTIQPPEASDDEYIILDTGNRDIPSIGSEIRVQPEESAVHIVA